MADPIGNYVAGLGFLGGPELNPKNLTPEQLAQLGLAKALPTPGLSLEVGPMMEHGMEGLENMSNLGQRGVPLEQNSAGIGYNPAPVVQAVADLATRGYLNAPALKNSAGVFGGMLSKDPDAVGRIFSGEAMRREGATPNQIWEDTKTWQGPDIKWHYEIPDTGSSLTNSATKALLNGRPGTRVIAPLGEILNHPAAYEAYPQLPDMMTKVGVAPGAAEGYFVHHQTPGLTQISAVASDIGGPQGLQGVLMHEVNHGIQGIEGFPSGSSTSAAKEYAKAFTDKLSKQIADLSGDHFTLTREQNPLDTEDLARISQQIARLRSMKNDFVTNFDPYKYYLRSAGEVESRGVQSRMLMPQDQLNAIPPEYMMGRDVPVPQRWLSYAGR